MAPELAGFGALGTQVRALAGATAGRAVAERCGAHSAPERCCVAWVVVLSPAGSILLLMPLCCFLFCGEVQLRFLVLLVLCVLVFVPLVCSLCRRACLHVPSGHSPSSSMRANLATTGAAAPAAPGHPRAQGTSRSSSSRCRQPRSL